MAEAIKHGVIADEGYFARVESLAGALHSMDVASPAMLDLVARSVEIKADVVRRDEREGGIRKTLNFGHTVGHAIELASGYSLLHGEAVAIGMIYEGLIAERIGVAVPRDDRCDSPRGKGGRVARHDSGRRVDRRCPGRDPRRQESPCGPRRVCAAGADWRDGGRESRLVDARQRGSAARGTRVKRRLVVAHALAASSAVACSRPDEPIRLPPVVVVADYRMPPVVVRGSARGWWKNAGAPVRFGDPMPVGVTMYCLQGRTRRGRLVKPGIAAADPRFFPLAQSIELYVGRTYVGRFLIDDTGKRVVGDRIDVWTADCRRGAPLWTSEGRGDTGAW